MLYVITRKNPNVSNVEVLYKSCNYNEAMDSLEIFALSTIEKLQGITNDLEKNGRPIYTVKTIPNINRGFYAILYYHKITVFEKKKNTVLYTGGTVEYCTFEMLSISLSKQCVNDFFTIYVNEDRETLMDEVEMSEHRYIIKHAIESWVERRIIVDVLALPKRIHSDIENWEYRNEITDFPEIPILDEK